MILAALVFSFHCLAPTTKIDGSRLDTTTVISRVVGLPIPYAFIVDDSTRGPGGFRYPRSYPLQGTRYAADSTRRYWTFVRADCNGSRRLIRNGTGWDTLYVKNYSAFKSLWGTAR